MMTRAVDVEAGRPLIFVEHLNAIKRINMSIKSVSLFYKAGSSDKVYQAQIEEKDNGYIVNFQFGRNGSALSTGTKTNTPVTMKEAEKIYDKLVSEKLAKGYTGSESGTPYQGSELIGKMSGMIPQLPNPITEEEAIALLEDDNFFMQEKEDGRHLMAEVNKDSVICSNRKGLIVSVSDTIAKSLQELKNLPIKVDGENMGEEYILFDILQITWKSVGKLDLIKTSAWSRFENLLSLVGDSGIECLSVAETAFTTEGKKELFNKIKAARGEGVVFKRKNALYIPGRPASGGDMLKFKFKESATCFVLSINPNSRSVGIAVNYFNVVKQVGNVTIYPNFAVPEAGSLIEVEYLYAYPEGSLYQPVYRGPRLDKDVADLYSTLKFKQGTLEEDSI